MIKVLDTINRSMGHCEKSFHHCWMVIYKVRTISGKFIITMRTVIIMLSSLEDSTFII